MFNNIFHDCKIEGSGGSRISQGAPTPDGGAPTYYFAKFFGENSMKMRVWTGGASLASPLESATDLMQLFLEGRPKQPVGPLGRARPSLRNPGSTTVHTGKIICAG